MNWGRWGVLAIGVGLLGIVTAKCAQAQIRITEWEYNGAADGDAGEFIELMNVGNTPIDMTGWSFDDNSRAPGSFSLSAFGVVQPKKILVISEMSESVFRAAWSLPASVPLIAGNNQNLGRADEINIYDSTNSLVDRLTFGDNSGTTTGSIRTNGNSGNPLTLAALGANDVFQWKKAVAGDVYGSYTSTEGNVGNPGIFTLVPEPATALLLMMGAAVVAVFRRR
jgi:predicted extracellular nuclease